MKNRHPMASRGIPWLFITWRKAPLLVTPSLQKGPMTSAWLGSIGPSFPQLEKGIKESYITWYCHIFAMSCAALEDFKKSLCHDYHATKMHLWLLRLLNLFGHLSFKKKKLQIRCVWLEPLWLFLASEAPTFTEAPSWLCLLNCLNKDQNSSDSQNLTNVVPKNQDNKQFRQVQSSDSQICNKVFCLLFRPRHQSRPKRRHPWAPRRRLWARGLFNDLMGWGEYWTEITQRGTSLDNIK